MQKFTINDKPAYKIKAKKKAGTNAAYLFDCEGDQHWFPKSCVKIIDTETILIAEWLYNKTFPTGAQPAKKEAQK